MPTIIVTEVFIVREGVINFQTQEYRTGKTQDNFQIIQEMSQPVQRL